MKKINRKIYNLKITKEDIEELRKIDKSMLDDIDINLDDIDTGDLENEE